MRIQRRRDLGFSLLDDGAILVRAQTAGIGARIPPVALGVLAFFTRARPADDAVAAFGPQAGSLVEGLLGVGLLVPEGEADSTPVFFDNFSALDVHRRMLEDRGRIEAYRRALEVLVEPGSAVLDAGTGSGVLGILAARAGAARVEAVDNSAMIDRARGVVADSGLADVVRCVRSDFATVQVEPVDLVVTETFGSLALAEGAAADLQKCIARNLRPGGRVIPSELSLVFAPVVEPEAVAPLFGPWQVEGVDFSSLVDAQRLRGVTRLVDPAHLGRPGQTLGRLAFPDEAERCAGTLRFDGLERPLVALCGWFVLHLAPGVDLPTGPSDPPTHWQQALLPLELEPVDGVVELQIRVEPAPDDRRALLVRADWSGGSREWRLR